MRKPLVTRFGAVVAFVLAAPLLAACGDPLANEANAGSGPQVVASFYPLQYVAQRVTGEHAEVIDLTAAGSEPHDQALTPAQVAAVGEADLALYEKGFQPAVDAALSENGPAELVDAAEAAKLEGGDPHFWLDPSRLADVAAAFTDRLVKVDPDHAADYRANLDALRADLTELDSAYADTLSRCARDTVVVSHDAFGYLEKYGLRFEAIAGLSPDAEPSPAHITELQDLIRDRGITTVFSETLVSPAMAETIAGDLGLETAVLDPIEGLSEQTANEDYLSLMRSNLAALKEANQCR